MAIRITHVLLALLALSLSALRAQTQPADLEIDTRSDGSVTVCGEALLFTVTIRNTSGELIQNMRLYPTLPVGMVYVPGSAQSMTQVLSDTSFIISDLAEGEQRVVRFQAKADCRLLATLRVAGATNNLINNQTRIRYTVAGSSKEIHEPNGSESYSVLYPELELIMPENEKNQGAPFINKTINRHLTIRNTGLGRVSSIDFYVKNDAELAFDALKTGDETLYAVTGFSDPILGKKYILTDFSGVGNGDAFLDENEEIVLMDYVRATTANGSIGTAYTAQWGCGGLVCNADDRQAQFTAYIQAVGGEPLLQRVSNQVVSKTDFCSKPTVVQWAFSNAGSGNMPASRDAAFNVEFDLYLYSPATTDTYSFYIKNVNDGSLKQIDRINYTVYPQNSTGVSRYYSKQFKLDLNDYFQADPDGAGRGLEDVDGDTYFDDLPAGNTVTFTSEVLSSLTAPADYSYNLNYSLSTILIYQNWAGELRSFGSFAENITLRVLSAKMTGPSDLIDGATRTVSFELQEYNASTLLNIQNATFRFNLTLPQGVTVTGARWNNTALSLPAQTGNTLTFFSPLFKSPGYTTIDFDYTLTCGANVPQVDAIQLDMYYYFDLAGCPSNSFKVATASKQVYLHCTTCATETTQFTAERKTLGWPTPPYYFYRYSDLFAASPKYKPLTTTTGLRLDAAYPKDMVQASVQGRIASTSAAIASLSTEIKYTAPMQNKEVLHVVSASFIVGSTAYTVPVSTVQPTIHDSTYTYVFNIPLGTPGFPAQLAPGQSFQVNVNFKVDELNGVSRGEYPLVDFRGRFLPVGGGGATDCLGFGDDFLLFKPRVNVINSTYTFTDQDKMVIGNFRFEGGNKNIYYGIQDFPNEFRPVFYNAVQVITLPEGFIFDRTKPVSFSIGPPNGSNLNTITAVTFSADNRTLTIGGNVLNDIPIVNYLDIYFLASVNVDCSNPDNLFVPSTAAYDVRKPLVNNYKNTSFAYLELGEQVTPSAASTVTSDIYNFRRPNLKLTANSVQEGFGETVSWPIQLCNPQSPYGFLNSVNTWVAFELKSDDHSTVIQAIQDEQGKVIPFSYYGPKDANHPQGRNVLVKLETVKLSSCVTLKAIATYVNCQEDVLQDIQVYASWDYYDYPDVSQVTDSIVNHTASCEGSLFREKMTIKYKTAELQWQVRKNGPAEIDLCVASPFEIDLASTKYGDMKQLKVWMQLPAFATLDQVNPLQFYYPYHAAPAPAPADAFIQQNGKIGIDVAKLIGGNLPGIHSNDNKIKLAFNINTSCGFDPGLPIKYTVKGLTNCGDSIEFTDQRKIRLSGLSANPADSLELKLTAPSSLTCNNDNEISLQIKNLGDSTSTFHKLEILLPAGTSYKETTAGDLPPPVVATVNKQVRLLWTLPDGYLSAHTSKAITIKTFLSQTPVGTAEVLFVARTYISADGHCAEDNEACNMQVTKARTELAVPVNGLANLTITTSTYVCAYQFKAAIDAVGGCSVTSYAWNFGDGGTSSEASPFHSFGASGTYTVSLNVNFNCGGCHGMQSKQIQLSVVPGSSALYDTIIEVQTDIKKQVIQASVATFTDTWPIQHVNPDLDAKHSFLNGTQGVWRNEASYVYETSRQATDQVKIAQDGTFDLNQFDWQFSDFDAVPGWVKATAMTQYSPFSYELENRDVLGIYSAALYDYGGHLPSANGVNMRHAEMAFTSFEFLDKKSSGNWIFGTQSLPSYYLYNVYKAQGNSAIVEASLLQLGDAEKADVVARTPSYYFRLLKILYPFPTSSVKNNAIVCKVSYPLNPAWSIVVFKTAPFPKLWNGTIKITNTVVPDVSPDVDTTYAHSGESSLKITAEKTFVQRLLQLEAGKDYVVNAWVSVGHVGATPNLAENLGIDVVLRNSSGKATSTFSFVPAGPVIEGWQQVKGMFTYAGSNGTTLELKFKPGSTGTAWYDDLRLHPAKGNMKSYVYNLTDYRLRAILDEENFASFFYYDAEGNLYLTKKETEGGIKTITENISYQKEN